MFNVIPIKDSIDIPKALRSIADSVESGDFLGETCTVVLDTEVFHLGCVHDEQAARDAVWNLSYGIHKLMSTVFKEQ